MDHELAALLPGFDLFDQEQGRRHDEILAHARRHCPVTRTSTEEGLVMVTTYEDVRDVLEAPEVYSSVSPVVVEIPVRLPPIDTDPPFQQELRGILIPFFTRSHLLRFEPQLRQIARDAIDHWIDTGR